MRSEAGISLSAEPYQPAIPANWGERCHRRPEFQSRLQDPVFVSLAPPNKASTLQIEI